MNPKAYCLTKRIKTEDFIRKAQEVAPKYTKVQHSMASNPDYGVVLAPSVVSHIKGNEPTRTKPCQFTFRLGTSENDEFNKARQAMGHSKQQAAEYAARLYIEKAATLLAQGSGGDGGAVENTVLE